MAIQPPVIVSTIRKTPRKTILGLRRVVQKRSDKTNNKPYSPGEIPGCGVIKRQERLTLAPHNTKFTSTQTDDSIGGGLPSSGESNPNPTTSIEGKNFYSPTQERMNIRFASIPNFGMINQREQLFLKTGWANLIRRQTRPIEKIVDARHDYYRCMPYQIVMNWKGGVFKTHLRSFTRQFIYRGWEEEFLTYPQPVRYLFNKRQPSGLKTKVSSISPLNLTPEDSVRVNEVPYDSSFEVMLNDATVDNISSIGPVAGCIGLDSDVRITGQSLSKLNHFIFDILPQANAQSTNTLPLFRFICWGPQYRRLAKFEYWLGDNVVTNGSREPFYESSFVENPVQSIQHELVSSEITNISFFQPGGPYEFLHNSKLLAPITRLFQLWPLFEVGAVGQGQFPGLA